MDSNIILSQYIEDDVYQDSNKLILSQKDLSCITAFISVIEVKSIIGRLWRKNQIYFKPEIQDQISTFSLPTQIQMLTEFCFRNLQIQVHQVFLMEKTRFANLDFTLDANFSLAFRFGSSLSLRTLDLIQIASAINIKLYNKIPIDYFLTNDQQILENGADVRNATKILPISSDDLVNILKIKSIEQ